MCGGPVGGFLAGHLQWEQERWWFIGRSVNSPYSILKYVERLQRKVVPFLSVRLLWSWKIWGQDLP